MKRILLSFFFILCASVSFAYDVEVDGIYYNLVDGKAVVTYKGNTYDQSISYSESVEIPTDISVSGVKYSVTSIGESAFNGCSGLTSVTIPNSVRSIGNRAFYGCLGLTSMTIPNSVTSIGSGAFQRCSRLTLVTIPNSVTSLGEYAFLYCSSLTSITIPNSVTSLGRSAFSGCSTLTSVTIGNSVTSIEDYTFERCSSLTSITIPNSVTSIGFHAFSGCSGLVSMTIPNSVTSIGSSAFSDCSGLKGIHCQSVTPPHVNESSTFSKVNTNYCKLYVPIGSKETYAFAEGWRLFSNIIEENVISDGDNKCAAPSIAFKDGQLKFTSETPNAKFLYTITDTDIKTSLESCEDGNVKLSATYLITAYAEAEGYSTSNATTATLVWLDARLDCTSTDAKEITVNAKPLLITQNAGIVNISGLQDGEKVSAYDASGKQIATSKAIGAETMIDLSSQQGKAAIINVGGKSVKVVIK